MRADRAFRVAMLVTALLRSEAAFAMHPMFSDDTGTQGAGGVLIESSINYLKDNQYKSIAVPVAVTAGIGASMDIAVEMPYLWLHPSPATGNDENGLSDVIFRFKQRFWGQEKKGGEHVKIEQSFAYQVAYAQPTGNEQQGLGAGTSRWAARLISTTEWESVEINANVGYESSGRALRRGNFTFDDAVFLSLAARYERSKPWEPVAELVVIRVKGQDALTRIASALVGLIYEASEQLSVDAGVRVGLNAHSEDYALLAGFGYKF
jgi:hypothetical protein